MSDLSTDPRQPRTPRNDAVGPTSTPARDHAKTPRILLGATIILALLLLTAPAAAIASGPQWTLTAVSRPTNFLRSDPPAQDAYVITVTNTGSAPTDGSTVTIDDELPEGLTLPAAGATISDQLSGASKKCLLTSCSYSGIVAVNDTLIVRVPVTIAAQAASSLTNAARVSGGGAPDAAMETLTAIGSERAGFGISPGGASTALSSTQAGAHPDITTAIAFNTTDAQGALAGDVKETIADLPAGFAGDLIDTPSCPAASFLQAQCALATQVGITTVALNFGGTRPVEFESKPVYNLTPDPGEVAKFGFVVEGVFVEGGVYIRPDYGLRVVFQNINQAIVELDSVSLTVWGVPAETTHDVWRWQEPNGIGSFGHPSDAAHAPFFTNPTACPTAPLQARFTVDSWQQPEAFQDTQTSLGQIIGCDRLSIEPSLKAEATTSSASAPSGLALTMSIPQTYDNPLGLATSTLKKAVITLPEGMTVNPSAGSGLAACSEAQYAEESAQAVPGHGCPKESKLGTVKIVTPSLKEEATGSVFLATPYENPSGSLLALYIVARFPERGVIVKAAGEVHADEGTGRLVTSFDELAPLPFSSFTFNFRQGATSPLVTPPTCGIFTVAAALTPWARPLAPPLTPPIPGFPITSSFNGGACPSGATPPFAPQFSAGTSDSNAGAYSPLRIDITRTDGEQEITRFSAQLPPGLTANLSGVPFCPDASVEAAKRNSGAQEEAHPSCPAASQIGSTLVGAGVGGTLAQAHGVVYLAGPYHGAPFSIAAITSARVGPFDLGTVVVRVALQINPQTAVVTVDANASDPIPHIIKGIVIHVREIRVNVDRPNFSLNPTSCDPMAFLGSIGGSGADFASAADDTSVNLSVPFRVTACQALSFKPQLQAQTSAKASKANGVGFRVKLTYPNAPQGTQANIRSVKVNLPRQLPSRLTTLQKACLARVFEANPAACPPQSVVGHARAITPILPVPIEGPAYFVSHGGEAFPSLILVLQGYGVTIDLVGSTFISRTGITSSTFKTVPDQPVSSFELTLPQGLYSALAANLPANAHGSFCGQKLAMPTEFQAQNGAVIHQSTPVGVAGCSHRPPTRAQRLAIAMRACGKQPARRRSACARQARRRYGPPKSRKH